MTGRFEIQERVSDSIQRLTNGCDFLQKFDVYLAERKGLKSPVSRQRVIQMVRQYLNYVGNPACDDWSVLTEDGNISGFLRSKRILEGKSGEKSPASSSYMRAIHYDLHLFFECAKWAKCIQENPMDEYSMPPMTDVPQRPALTMDDFSAIYQVVKKGNRHGVWRTRDMLIMQMLMTFGMRETALVSINVEDLDLESGWLTLVDKGNRTHKYSIAGMEKLIVKWLQAREKILDGQKSDALFLSSNKKRLSSRALVSLVWKYSEDAIGIRLSPHDIRAGVVTIMAQEKPLPFVSEYIGHRNVTTTSRYFITNEKEKVEGAKIMMGAFA